LKLSEQKVESCTIKDFEFYISKLFVVSQSSNTLPFQILDANNSILCDPNDEVEENKDQINVNVDTRLNYRWLDLRTETSQSIARVKTKVADSFRRYCLDNDFIEIMTPKLIPGSSEGGSAVFTFK